MAAHLLRLRAAVLISPMRGPWRSTLAATAGLAATVVVVGLAIRAIALLAAAPGDVVYVTSVAIGAAILLGFLAIPFVSGARDPLDVRAFTTLPLSPAGLAARLGVSGLITVPVFAVVAIDVALGAVWASLGGSIALAATSGALHVLLCVLAARIGFALNDALLRGRRSVELTVILALAAIAVVAPAALSLLSLSWDHGAPVAARALAGAVAFTPLGAATAVGAFGAVSTGSVGGAVAVSAVVAVSTLALAALAWGALVRRAFRTVPRRRSRASGRLGWFRILPGTAAGAIGARGILYWTADRRYLANLAIVPVAGLVPLVPLAMAGAPSDVLAMIPLPIVAAFLGWLAHNDLAYDSEAVWIHLVTGVRGVADRMGRLVPITILAVPTLAVTVAATAYALDAWRHVGVLAAVAGCLYLSGLGFSSIASVVTPYAVSRPGDSAFRQPQRTGARGVLAPSIALLASIGISTPTLVVAWNVLAGDGVPERAPIILGWTTGAGTLLIGIAIGAFLFDRRGHRAMELALRA